MTDNEDKALEDMTADELVVFIAETSAEALEIKAQLDAYRAGEIERTSNWAFRARYAWTKRRGDIKVANAILKTKTPKKVKGKVPEDTLQAQAVAHRAKLAKVQHALQRKGAECEAIKAWVRERFPEHVEEVYAVASAAAARFDLTDQAA